MTYLWVGVGCVLALGIGLIVWGSMTGPGSSGEDVSARRGRQAQIGALLAGLALVVLVVAYLTAPWP